MDMTQNGITDPAYLDHTLGQRWLLDSCTCRTRPTGERYWTCRTAGCDAEGQACGGYCRPCFNDRMENARIRGQVMRAIEAERASQDEKWGEQNHTDEWWLAILTEEVGETAQALLADRFGGATKMTTREELVQVAAVALAWLECMERRRAEV